MNDAAFQGNHQRLCAIASSKFFENVFSLSLTQQLKDDMTYAAANGLKFQLWVTPSTILSPPLQAAAASGQIILRTF